MIKLEPSQRIKKFLHDVKNLELYIVYVLHFLTWKVDLLRRYFFSREKRQQINLENSSIENSYTYLHNNHKINSILKTDLGIQFHDKIIWKFWTNYLYTQYVLMFTNTANLKINFICELPNIIVVLKSESDF